MCVCVCVCVCVCEPCLVCLWVLMYLHIFTLFIVKVQAPEKGVLKQCLSKCTNIKGKG